MKEKTVLQATNYDRVDGRNANQSKIKRITLGYLIYEENKGMKIAAQLWQEGEDGKEELKTELPIHQIIDLMLVLSRSMLYFREAYRYSPPLPAGKSHGGSPWGAGWCHPHRNLPRKSIPKSRYFGIFRCFE